MLPNQEGNYYSYLLRFWRDDAASPWRVMLQDPLTGQSHGFPSMAQLYTFLEGQTNNSQQNSTDIGE